MPIEATKRLYTYKNDFCEFVDHRDRYQSVPLEIDAEMFYYWLGVLPPVFESGEQNGESMRMFPKGYGGQWVRKDDTMQRFSFAFAEGYEYITVFWESGTTDAPRYFAQKTAIFNRRG